MKNNFQSNLEKLIYYEEQTDFSQIIVIDNKVTESLWNEDQDFILSFLHSREIQYAKTQGRFFERIGSRVAVKIAFRRLFPQHGTASLFTGANEEGTPLLWYESSRLKNVSISLTHIPKYSAAYLHST